MSKSIQEFLGQEAINELMAAERLSAERRARPSLGGETPPMSTGPAIEKMAESGLVTGLRGFGRGASLGLTDPLAALVLKGTRAMTGGAPMSFQDALSEVKRINKQVEENPLYRGGELAGNIGVAAIGTPAAVAARGGGPAYAATFKPTVKRGAAAGAISGVGETENLSDLPQNIGIGALVGLTSSAIPGLASKTAYKLAERDVLKRLAERDVILDRMIRDIPNLTAEQKSALSMRLGNFLTEEYIQPGPVVGRTLKKIGETAIGAIGPGTLGALGGAGTALITGNDPMTGALIGGAGIAAASKASAIDDVWRGIRDLSLKPLIRSDVIVPTVLETAARTAQPTITQQIIERNEEDRLRKLADDFIRKYGTQQ
jgi:hypothetical protein